MPLIIIVIICDCAKGDVGGIVGVDAQLLGSRAGCGGGGGNNNSNRKKERKEVFV